MILYGMFSICFVIVGLIYWFMLPRCKICNHIIWHEYCRSKMEDGIHIYRKHCGLIHEELIPWEDMH